VKNEVILVVAKGDARLDNKKLKDTFGAKRACSAVMKW
jgi:prolyl-tRNA editing enzyme YbaK/EbsC (Cys-tRNA(Pro) deacylase)